MNGGVVGTNRSPETIETPRLPINDKPVDSRSFVMPQVSDRFSRNFAFDNKERRPPTVLVTHRKKSYNSTTRSGCFLADDNGPTRVGNGTRHEVAWVMDTRGLFTGRSFLSKKLKIRFYTALIQPVVLYETWTPEGVEETK